MLPASLHFPNDKTDNLTIFLGFRTVTEGNEVNFARMFP